MTITAHSIHVAILDDDASIRAALNRLLTMAGMVVDTYATGSLFLDSLALRIPNCLLLDFQMPEMRGLDVLRYLGQRHICIPTIVITAYAENGSREASMKAGAVAYLLKPLDADLLVETIVNICGKPPGKPLPPLI